MEKEGFGSKLYADALCVQYRQLADMKNLLSSPNIGATLTRLKRGLPLIQILTPDRFGVSDSTHDCESDIRVLVNAFRCFGWGVRWSTSVRGRSPGCT